MFAELLEDVRVVERRPERIRAFERDGEIVAGGDANVKNVVSVGLTDADKPRARRPPLRILREQHDDAVAHRGAALVGYCARNLIPPRCHYDRDALGRAVDRHVDTAVDDVAAVGSEDALDAPVGGLDEPRAHDCPAGGGLQLERPVVFYEAAARVGVHPEGAWRRVYGVDA